VHTVCVGIPGAFRVGTGALLCSMPAAARQWCIDRWRDCAALSEYRAIIAAPRRAFKNVSMT